MAVEEKKKRGRPPKKKENLKSDKYYDVHDLWNLSEKDKNIRYMIAFGQRGKGKSTSACLLALEHYLETGNVAGIIRRWDDDWTGITCSTYMDSLVKNELNINYVRDRTHGEWDSIQYYRSAWYLSRYDADEDKVVKADEPFAYRFALNTWEKYKSIQITSDLVIMEEFISGKYIGAECEEFNNFLNMISTIIRNKAARVILLGNSIRFYGNPYFISMGILGGVKKMNPGDTVIFENGRNKLKIAVHYTMPPDKEYEENIMYDFTDSAAARMITEGEWQLEAKFPLLPNMNVGKEKEEKIRIRPMDKVFTYFMKYLDVILQADVILQDNKFFTYFHKKTTEIKDEDEQIIFDLDYHLEPNYRRDITRPTDNIGKKIYQHFISDSVYCQDVETSEVLYSYIESLG